MKLRIVRFVLDTGQYETLATSLPRSFTLQEIKELYHARWGIETAFRELKYGFGLVNLHGKNDDFVKQEIFAAMIMSNFCSRIAGKVVVEKPKKNIHAYKVNWNMAVYLCKKFYREENGNAKQLMKDIAKYTEAVRLNRSDTRGITSPVSRSIAASNDNVPCLTYSLSLLTKPCSNVGFRSGQVLPIA